MIKHSHDMGCCWDCFGGRKRHPDYDKNDSEDRDYDCEYYKCPSNLYPLATVLERSTNDLPDRG